VNDLEVLSRRSRGSSLMRSARTGAALFGGGMLTGLVIALLFGTLIRAVLLTAAVVIVLVAVVRMVIGRDRS
jgi:sugar phosphate permease